VCLHGRRVINQHSLINMEGCVNHRGRSYSLCPTDGTNSPTPSTGTNCCVVCMVNFDTGFDYKNTHKEISHQSQRRGFLDSNWQLSFPFLWMIEFSMNLRRGFPLVPRTWWTSLLYMIIIKWKFNCIWLIWRSGDRASWYILIIKPTRCTNFSNLFWTTTRVLFRK